MKKVLFTCIAAILVSISQGQTPEKMSYQAVIRNGSGELVASQTISLKLSILQGSSTGTEVYVETQQPSTNQNGLLTVEIGGGSVISGSIGTIDWSSDIYFIKTEVDLAGGSTYNLNSISQLLSVPYALHAKTAESVVGGTGNGFTHYIGEYFQGGIIFHLYKDDAGIEHGLVVSIEDVGFAGWDNFLVNASNSWDGKANTDSIMQNGGDPNKAAGLCESYSYDGYDDWYLPSLDELILLFTNKYNVNRSLSQMNGIDYFLAPPDSYYWGSSNSINGSQITEVYGIGILGVTSSMFVNDSRLVRAIRRF